MKPQAWRRIVELLAIAALGLGGWVVVSALRPSNSAPSAQVATVPTGSTAPPTVTAITLAISPTTPKYPTTYPIGKQTLEANVEQTQAAVTLVPPVETPHFNPPPPGSQPLTPWDWGTGILHEGDAPFSAMEFLINNQWYGMLDGNRVQVYAGGIKDNPGVSQDASQGVLIIVISTPGQDYPPEIHKTPTKAGPLSVLEAQGARLKLAVPNATEMYFDIPARQFVASFTAPVIAATPMVPTGYP